MYNSPVVGSQHYQHQTLLYHGLRNKLHSNEYGIIASVEASSSISVYLNSTRIAVVSVHHNHHRRHRRHFTELVEFSGAQEVATSPSVYIDPNEHCRVRTNIRCCLNSQKQQHRQQQQQRHQRQQPQRQQQRPLERQLQRGQDKIVAVVIRCLSIVESNDARLSYVIACVYVLVSIVRYGYLTIVLAGINPCTSTDSKSCCWTTVHSLMDDLPEVVYSSEDELGEDDIIHTKQLIEKLHDSWLDEQFCPELLRNQQSSIDMLLESMETVENLTNRAISQTSGYDDFRIVAHRLEIDRLRYCISSYLRRRLSKINQMFRLLIRDDIELAAQRRPLLTAEEFAYAQQMAITTDQHVNTTILRFLPSNLQQVRLPCEHASIDCFVFIRPVEDLPSFTGHDRNGEPKTITLLKGQLYVIAFRHITEFLKQSKVHLT